MSEEQQELKALREQLSLNGNKIDKYESIMLDNGATITDLQHRLDVCDKMVDENVELVKKNNALLQGIGGLMMDIQKLKQR